MWRCVLILSELTSTAGKIPVKMGSCALLRDSGSPDYLLLYL